MLCANKGTKLTNVQDEDDRDDGQHGVGLTDVDDGDDDEDGFAEDADHGDDQPDHEQEIVLLPMRHGQQDSGQESGNGQTHIAGHIIVALWATDHTQDAQNDLGDGDCEASIAQIEAKERIDSATHDDDDLFSYLCYGQLSGANKE